MFGYLYCNNWCLTQLSHTTAQSSCFPNEEYCNMVPWAVKLFRGKGLFVPKAISEAGCLETEVMWPGNCLRTSVWKIGYTRTCGWLEGERQMPSCHVPLSTQLAVSLTRLNTACGVSESLVYWLHRDLMVRSCSIIIYNVYVTLCTIWCFNEWSSVSEQNCRSEGEGTRTRHEVTEVEFMFLDVSCCIYIQYRMWKTTSICVDAIFVSFVIFVSCQWENLRSIY
jgi:hypothetical protein